MAQASPAPPTTASLARDVLDHKAQPYAFSFTPFLQRTYQHGLPASAKPSSAAASTNPSYNSLVCKHWLRGLCKKGDACEFLHEYNLRRMPECWWYAKYNYCSAGDECLYAHPKERKVECPDYKRGFCKLGASRSFPSRPTPSAS